MLIRINDATVELLCGDITREDVDVIVNAANAMLRGGGGVDGAIHHAGGPTIMAECRLIGSCPTGGAVITNAGNLIARRIVHAVGPIWRGGNNGEAEQLASCYRRALELAAKERLASVSFPAISTGVYGYPPREAAQVAARAIYSFLSECGTVELVRQVMFDTAALSVIEKVWRDLAQEKQLRVE